MLILFKVLIIYIEPKLELDGNAMIARKGWVSRVLVRTSMEKRGFDPNYLDSNAEVMRF
jgi:hypothetical protein